MDEQISLRLAVSEPEADDERVDHLRRLLQGELKDGGITTTRTVDAASAPAGAKSAEVLSIGALAAVVTQSAVPRLIELIQSWVTSGERSRTVHYQNGVRCGRGVRSQEESLGN